MAMGVIATMSRCTSLHVAVVLTSALRAEGPIEMSVCLTVSALKMSGCYMALRTFEGPDNLQTL